ncbi:MAG: hypothetical protein EP329_18935 [Deltaproteobacteria bacterium]|nr:MAG: hypothetical protein EP329_18935 [Deltaproteobacteria bacterium]
MNRSTLSRTGALAGALATLLVASAAQAAEPYDFTPDAHALARVVACSEPDAPLPDGITEGEVRHHCRAIAVAMKKYRTRWLPKAQPFFAEVVPAGLPDVVVYPFGGADLTNALAVFPDAREITTLSLEYSGDPRALRSLRGKRLAKDLQLTREFIAKLIAVNHNRTIDLDALVDEPVPVPLVFALVGLAIHDRELVSVRYFTLGEDGAVRYLTDEDVAALDDALAAVPEKRREAWLNERFANVEVRFKRRGVPDAPVQVFRHIRENLADSHFTPESPLYRHLAAKGRITAMTKAASYLLWRAPFSNIRGWLLSSMAWMISDSTCPTPTDAAAAGFEQDVWGRFDGAMFSAPHAGAKDMAAHFASRPYRKIAFFFGYPDVNNQPHLVVTRPKASE